MTFSGGSWNRDRANPVQFHARVAVIGGLALVMFAVIFFRLWYLQVLSGDQYLAEAQGNRVREVTVQAPRGEIRDRDGKLLVGNRTALALQVRADELPEERGAPRRGAAQASAEVAGMRADEDPQGDPPADEGAAVEPGHAEARRADRARVVPAREPGALPRGHRGPGLRPRSTRGARSPPTCSGTCARSGPEQLKEARYQELEPGDEIGQEGARVRPTTTSCAA